MLVVVFVCKPFVPLHVFEGRWSRKQRNHDSSFLPDAVTVFSSSVSLQQIQFHSRGTLVQDSNILVSCCAMMKKTISLNL